MDKIGKQTQERNPIRNIDLGLTCSCFTSLVISYIDVVAHHLAFYFKLLLRYHIVLYGIFYPLYCIPCEIIMAYLWSSFVWRIWHIILYCNAWTSSYISLYYIAYCSWLCCLIHGIVVASHVLGYYSFDIIYYVRDIIHLYRWPLFPNNIAYHAVL